MAIFGWHAYKTCYHLSIKASKPDCKHVLGHCCVGKEVTPFAALPHFIKGVYVTLNEIRDSGGLDSRS